MLALLVVFSVPVLVVCWAVWVARRRTPQPADRRIAHLAEASAERTRAGFSCGQLPTEKPAAPRVRGRS